MSSLSRVRSKRRGDGGAPEQQRARPTALRRSRVLLGGLVAAACATGCWSTRFVKTDASFYPARSGVSPEAFLDRRPPHPYRSVGIIEVTGPANSFDLDRVVAKAVDKGKELGCDVIVDRALHPVSVVRGPILVAQLGQPGYGSQPLYTQPAPAAQPVYMPAPGPGRREFVCGIYE